MVPTTRVPVVVLLILGLTLSATQPALSSSTHPTAAQADDSRLDRATPGETTPTRLNGSSNVTSEQVGDHTYLIEVGDKETQLGVLLNLSFFMNLPGPGTLRFASYGLLDDQRIVAVSIMLDFEGTGDLPSFFGDPLSRFQVQNEFSLQLPLLNERPASSPSEGDPG
jgi:hypothetical protein